MPIVQPTQPKSRIEDDGAVLRVIIPIPRRWFWIFWWTVQTLVWGSFWFYQTVFFILSLFKDNVSDSEALVIPVGFMICFTLFLGIPITLGLYSCLSFFTGRQETEISAESLIIRRIVASLSRPKEYLAEHIKDLRAGHKPANSSDSSFDTDALHIRDDGIAFDYGAKTIYFGLGIDEAEAKQIVAKILARFPQYAPH